MLKIVNWILIALGKYDIKVRFNRFLENKK